MWYWYWGRSPELDDHESQSTADVAGLKRRRSSADSLVVTKILRTSSGGRPKAADYDDSLKALILSAISYYRANLSSLCAFPDIATEAEMLTQVWKFTCAQLETTASLTPQIAKLVWLSPLSLTLYVNFLLLPDYEPRFPAPWRAQVEDSPSSRRFFWFWKWTEPEGSRDEPAYRWELEGRQRVCL